MKQTVLQAYIIGVALGDGNLSRPNGRATRLRITCDNKYPKIASEITLALQKLFPKNKVSRVASGKNSYFNISVYSNQIDILLPWKVGAGSKFIQNACVPAWIKEDKSYVKNCLRGLLQTDGSIYTDRGYLMVNFTNITKSLATDVLEMIEFLGYKPHLYTTLQKSGNYKYTVRLSRQTKFFIEEIGLQKI